MTVTATKTCEATKNDGEPCASTILCEHARCYHHCGLCPSRTGRRARGFEGATLAELERKERRENADPRFYEWGLHLDPHFDVPKYAVLLGQSEQHLYKCRNETQYQAKLRDVSAGWTPPRPDGIPESHFDLTEDHIPILIADFLSFRKRFFKTERRKPFVTPEFQQVWATAIVRTLVTGGKQVVLAPVRHGKTTLLAHLSTYLICLFPNIRIGWISVAEKIAAKPVGMVARILAGNKELVAAYAGPAGGFKPSLKDGQSWSKTEFTVATRTAFDISGASMMAIGRGGTLVSLNFDVIVVDDPEDNGSVAQAGTREGTRSWWTEELDARVEEHTGLFVIGTRRHVDDLYGHLLENDEYEVIVDQAHNPACTLDEHDYNIHVDCMLFPEVRSYRWLQKQRLSSETTGGEASFQLIYQNNVTGSGLAVFDKTSVLACRSADTIIGKLPTKDNGGFDPAGSGLRLVAGLDPAHVGFQASTLWAFQTAPELKIWLVDLENREGGGVPAAERIIRRWYDEYKLSHWVVESNLLGSMHQYRELADYASRNGIRLQDFGTYANKADPFYGVTTLAPLFKTGTFVLPYGDEESKAKTDLICKQFIVWDGSSSRNRNAKAGQKDDLVMSSWFAFDPIRRARQEFNTEMGVEHDSGYQGYDWNEAPWDTPGDMPW